MCAYTVWFLSSTLHFTQLTDTAVQWLMHSVQFSWRKCFAIPGHERFLPYHCNTSLTTKVTKSPTTKLSTVEHIIWGGGGHQYGTCFMSPCWRLLFFKKFFHPGLTASSFFFFFLYNICSWPKVVKSFRTRRLAHDLDGICKQWSRVSALSSKRELFHTAVLFTLHDTIKKLR